MLVIINHFIGNLILSLSHILFAKIVLKQKIKISWCLFTVLIILTAILHTLMVANIVGLLKTMLTCLIIMLNFKICFNINWKSSIFLTITYVIILLIPDLLVLLIATGVLGIDKVYYYEVVAGSLYGTLFVCIGLIGITYLLRRPLSKLLNIKLENNIKIIIFSGLTLLCVGFLFYFSFLNIQYNYGTLISLLIIIVFIIILFSLTKEKMDNESLMKRYDRLLDFMKTYEKEIEEQRIIRHENKNNLIAIKSKVVDKESNDKLIEYINELIDDYRKVDKEQYAKYVYLPANGLKGLFYYKTDEAEHKKIKVKINVSKDIKGSFLDKITSKQFKLLGNVLGVYLDNAIEASYDSIEKQLGIEIYCLKGNITFIISNTYNNKIDINKIGKSNYTTKGKNHGHGLLLVNHIINKNNNFLEESKEITDNLYIQKLTVKKI